MKKLIVISLFILVPTLSYSQLLDLIVTISGDSIACRIDSITETQIFFEMKDRNNWVHTDQFLDKIAAYKQNSINKKSYIFEPGTTRILKAGNIDLHKASKLQKTGKTFTIVGGATLGASILSIIAFGEQMDMGAILFAYSGLAGVGAMAVGIPMNLTGKKRVDRINLMKNSAFDQINVDLKPCQQYNLLTQKYQPVITLRIRF